MTPQLNLALIRKLRVIDVLSLFVDILSMGVRTTRHWQTSRQLVHELNVFIVHALDVTAKYCKWCRNLISVLYMTLTSKLHVALISSIKRP